MPLLAYTWVHEDGSVVTDKGLFPVSKDYEKIITQCDPIFRLHPNCRVTACACLNPHVHLHSWKATHKQGFRTYYTCTHCAVVSYRRFSMVHGEVGEHIREEAWKASRYELCHDQLKKLPPATKLF